jgi:hypothetical protein
MNVANAMREVHNNVPRNVKRTGKTGMAKERMLRAIAFSKAGESKKDSSGSNFVSPNRLYVPPGAESGKCHAAKTVPYKPRPGIAGKDTATPELVGNEREQVVHPGTGSLDGNIKASGFGPSYVGEGIDTVMPVERKMNPIEASRQRNNCTRDQRTNLGRGKASQPTTDAGGSAGHTR